MAYYPIKCPYCLQELSNDEVYFHIRQGEHSTGVVIKTREIREGMNNARRNDIRGETEVKSTESSGVDGWGGTPDTVDSWDSEAATDSWLDSSARDQGTAAGDTLSGGGEWISQETVPAGGAGQVSQSGELAGGYYTLPELENHFGDDIEAIYNYDIIAPPALTNNKCQGHLLIGVDITTRRDGIETVTRYLRRYCGCKKEDGNSHNELMEASGSEASYIVLMLGPSDSGKTVYLLALHRALRARGGYMLPPKSTGSRGVAKVIVTVLSGGGMGDTAIEVMSDKLFEEGELPLSTISMANEPLVLDVAVNFANGKSNNALVFLRDMPGELLINPEKTEELHKIAHQFPEFDGFIMMLDPFTFLEQSVFQKEGEIKPKDYEKKKYIDRLSQVLVTKVIPYMKSGSRITKPTTVIITKSDHFFDRENSQRLQQKGVERSLPVLSPYQKESFDKHYFRENDSGVKLILSKLSENILNMMERCFGNVSYSLASALSKEPIEIVNRTVTTPNAIKPWRVTDSFIRLMMRLGIVPPLDEVEIRKPDLEDIESAKARNRRYLDQINGWGSVYCSAWDELYGELIEITPQTVQGKPPGKPPGKPQRRGLFNRRG